MPAFPRAAIDVLQRAFATRLGGRLGREASLAVARAAARDFARIPGVETVYLTGSWTRPASAAPGYSDIDLRLAVDVPTLDAEMRLRRRIHATQQRWNVLATLFKHVDYFDACDFEALRRGGNAFWIGADDRFVALAGRSALLPGRVVHRYARTERIINALRRWTQVSGVMLDPTFARPDPITRRAAKRLLSRTIADALGANPNDAADALIARGCATLPALAGFLPPPESATTESLAIAYIVASLRAVDAFAAKHAADAGSFGPPRPRLANDLLQAVAERAGFRGAALVSLPPPRGEALTLVFAEDDAAVAVERLRRHFGALASACGDAAARRPAIFTPAMAHVGHLLFPVPEAGESLAAVGTPWGAPPDLDARERGAVAVGRTLELFVRPRGRAFRVGRSPSATLRALAEDVYREAPRIRAYRTGEALPELARIPSAPDERTLIAELRAHIARERPFVQSALGLDVT